MILGQQLRFIGQCSSMGVWETVWFNDIEAPMKRILVDFYAITDRRTRPVFYIICGIK